MTRFRYAADPVALVSCGLYAINRWLVKPQLEVGFLHDHFNDLLLVPAALPTLLWLHRRLGWRAHDGPPSAGEIALHTVIWAVICEAVGPQLTTRATGDVRDVVAYTVGALAAGTWWHFRRSRARAEATA